MTRQDFLIKWGVYALALVPVWFLELFVLNRFPLFGVAPMLLPLAAVCVAVLEGTTAGAGFGLFVGILCDAAYFNTDGAMTVGLCLIGVGAGALAQYVLRQNLVGCLLCSFAALALIDGGAHRRPPAGRAGGAGRHARPGRTGDSLVPGLCVPGVRPVPVGVPPGAEKNRAVKTGRPATERGVAS